MRFAAFLSPSLLRLPRPQRKLSGNSNKPARRDECTASVLSPSTNLRNSAQFLRHHWRNAIARTAQTFSNPIAIDATAGRGSDAITLGRYLGPAGTVHAVDIQAAAIEETDTRYSQAADTEPMATLRIHNMCHQDLSVLDVPEASVSVIAYNLGWCPSSNADRSVVTLVHTTISSLKSAEKLIAVGGLISVMAYVGHAGGQEEEDAVIEWCGGLCKKEWSVVLVTYPNRENAPSLLLCERIS